MFAGGGTVGDESFVRGRNFILIDINPLLPELIKLKTWTKEINQFELNIETKEILEDFEFRVANYIDLVEGYDLIMAKKMHMWGNGL